MKRIQTLWKNNAGYTLFFLLYTVIFFLFVKTLAYTLPFVLGIFLGMLVKPICGFLEHKLHLERSRAAIFSAAGAYLLFLTAAFLLLFWFSREAIVFIAGEGYFKYEALSPQVRGALEKLLASVPDLTNRLSDTLPETIASVLPAVGGFFKLFLSIPAGFLVLALIPVSAYLFLRYRTKLPKACAYWIGTPKTLRLRHAIRGLSRTSAGFALSYSLIYAITFCESFIILHLLRLDYPLITAFIVAVSDIFPILGPGTVLLPICIYRLLCGNFLQAIGLFIGWIILTVIRQIIEPRLVSKITRTPAVAMLAAVYCGFVSGNFWLIPYVGLFFFLLRLLQSADFFEKKRQIPD